MRRAALVVLAVLVAAITIDAQVLPGTIIGVVRDASGAVLPGATITVTTPARPGGPVTVTTGAQGEYRVTGLPPGTYALSVSLESFSTYKESDLRVTVGGTTERNISLPLATVQESVTVTGASPLIDTRQTGIGATLSTQAVEALPNKRFTAAASFMTDLPGVTASNVEQAYSVNVMGSSGAETPLMVDGVVTNHPASGGGWTHFDLDAIGEVSATTLGASAEFQGAAGGVLDVITNREPRTSTATRPVSSRRRRSRASRFSATATAPRVRPASSGTRTATCRPISEDRSSRTVPGSTAGSRSRDSPDRRPDRHRSHLTISI
jgi:hypothetical protein